jgi:DNA polymerase-3 subunit epsilon
MTAQLTFESSGTPLRETTFVVLDCETTGIDSDSCAMTELAAIKICGGEVIGSFHSLINPRQKMSARIIALTGITNEEVANCPTIDQILPTFLEFLGNEIIVGHNVRFDIGFINAALEEYDYPRLTNKFLDTLHLAKKIIPGEVHNYKLSTLANYCRAETIPTHRAYADVQATIDVLHYLIGRSSALGVNGINDLLHIPTPQRRERMTKRELSKDAPRGPGVYAFCSNDEILYVGMSGDIRKRLPQYFLSDDRRHISDVMNEATHMSYIRTTTRFEARIAELRILGDIAPVYNVQDIDLPRMHFVVLDETESAPTFRVISRSPSFYETAYGPFTSRREAQHFCDGLCHVFRARTCTRPCVPGKESTTVECINSIRGVHSCFCKNNWDDVAIYIDRMKQSNRQLQQDFPSVAVELLKQMQEYSDRLLFEKAQKMYDYAHSLQKWMHRFSLIEHAATIPDALVNKLTFRYGRPVIRFKQHQPSEAMNAAVEVIRKHNRTIRKYSDDDNSNGKFVCLPQEFRERYHTAIFLSRNNLLTAPLNNETQATVAIDQSTMSATTIL